MGRRQRRRHRRRHTEHASSGYHSDSGVSQRGQRAYRSRRRSGWGMNLYRNRDKGRVGGVCAGLADHWEVEAWTIRLAAVVLFLFTGTLALWGYVAAWVLMAPRRRSRDRARDTDARWSQDESMARAAEAEYVEMEYDERHHDYRPRKLFRYSQSPSVRLQRARDRLNDAVQRVENMESYVTSRQFRLNRDIADLERA